MASQKYDIVQAFLEMQSEFPFGKEYVAGNLSKYITIIEQIMHEYPRGTKILSIGSGPCDLEAILSKLGYEITAIDDLNDQWHLIGKNRERIKNFAKQMNIELIIHSADSPQTKENYFDVVLLIDIIEHLHNSPRELLNYSISALKPNGLLIIETPNTVLLANRLKVLFGKSNQVSANFIYWNIGEYRSHIREYTQSELKQILSYHNLVDVKSKMINVRIGQAKSKNLFSIIKVYKLISNIYPNFRGTILISGKKPNNWHPTDVSVKNFEDCYSHIKKYNLDSESDELLVNKMM